MKKYSKIAISILLVMLLSTMLFACNFKDFATKESEDLFKGATFSNTSGKEVNKISGAAGEYIDIAMTSKVSINTISLSEKKDSVTDFELYYKDSDGEMEFLYKQDIIQKFRYCTFDTISTDTIRIKVLSSKLPTWALKAKGHYITKTASPDFRIMGYMVSNTCYNAESIDAKALQAMTQINLIGSACLNSKGDVFFENKVIGEGKDAVTIDGTEYFEQGLANIRAALGDKKPKLILTILGSERGLESGEIHTLAMKDNQDKLIANINAILKKYDLDGAALDYEYPINSAQNKAYGNFVKALKQSMNSDKILALALSSWQFKSGQFPHSALKYVDQIEMMAYDQFTDKTNGYHSSFKTGCTNIFDELSRLNMQKYFSKIDLGIPFYSRPVDGYAYWGTYSGDVAELGRYGNLCKKEIKDNGQTLKNQYYNSYQMVYDKTNFCLDNQLGGVMIWHVTCDVPYDSDPEKLSLLGAITNAISSRS